MSYVDNAPLITAWNTRVQALKDRIETLYDGTSHNVLIENTSAEAHLSTLSLDSVESPSGVLTLGNLEIVSNGQAPQVVIEQPTLVLTPEEGSDESDQEEEKEDTVEETVEESSDQEDETVEETTEEEEEITSEE